MLLTPIELLVLRSVHGIKAPGAPGIVQSILLGAAIVGAHGIRFHLDLPRRRIQVGVLAWNRRGPVG